MLHLQRSSLAGVTRPARSSTLQHMRSAQHSSSSSSPGHSIAAQLLACPTSPFGNSHSGAYSHMQWKKVMQYWFATVWPPAGLADFSSWTQAQHPDTTPLLLYRALSCQLVFTTAHMLLTTLLAVLCTCRSSEVSVLPGHAAGGQLFQRTAWNTTTW